MQNGVSTIRTSGKILPLQNGDQLTRDEFERRYEAMPALKKAELVEGVVFMPSPVRADVHGTPDQWINTWIGYYSGRTPGVRGASNSTVRIDFQNEFQPDGLLFITTGSRPNAWIGPEDYIEGAPELICEISASSVSIDLGQKKDVYLRNGVKEYLVWRVLDEAVDWFILRNSRYELLSPDSNGILRSETFPGLWLNSEALLRSDFGTVLDCLQQGLVSQEHMDFVARLQVAPTSSGH
jgi:hypothetical protein